jgi:tetratricopeptide (TPR) repeat protein
VSKKKPREGNRAKPARAGTPKKRTVSPDEAFKIALEQQQRGNLAEAERIYREILDDVPDHADSLHFLGLIAHQRGESEEALELLRRSIALVPEAAVYHSNLGIVLQGQGKLDEAEAAYRRALELDPDLAEAHYNLGRVLQRQRKLDEAEAAYRRALDLRPDYAEAHENLARVLRKQGKLDGAEAAYRRAVELVPDDPGAHKNLARVLQKQGKLAEAEAAYRRTLELAPEDPEAHRNLGRVLRQQAKLDEAEAAHRCALELAPDDPKAHRSLGNALRDQGRLDEAEAACRRALQLAADDPKAHNLLAVVLQEQGKLDEAEAAYHKVIQLAPDFAKAHYNLGIALQDQGRLSEAEAAFRRTLELSPHSVPAHNNLASALVEQGRLDEAEAAYRRALELEPDFAELLHANLARVLSKQGKLDEAEAAYRRAIDFKPDFVHGHIQYATIRKFCRGDPEIEALTRLLEREDVAGDQRISLLFALGKVHDDIGLYAEAFSYYRQANEEKARELPFDPARHRRRIEEIEKVFRDRGISVRGDSGNADRVPVFVIGMSRAGKTLVESLLSQHKDVYGAGETHEWGNALRWVLDKYAIPDLFPDCMRLLGDSQIREIGEKYTKEISKLSSKSRFFVNTIPGNFVYIGLIFQAMPWAKIIYCFRDPRDQCLTVYFKNYAHGNGYSRSLRRAASYYADYQEMMAHWLELYGDRILSVRYEELVRDPTQTGARIYDYCGLDYDPAQIRAEFTADEIGRWKPYEPHLGELIVALLVDSGLRGFDEESRGPSGA